MTGKEKCRILKEIRQKIADENDITYITRKCTFQGECKGICPRCESELHYLEQQLEERRKTGRRIAITALSLSLAFGTVGCTEMFGSQKDDSQEDMTDLTGEVDDTRQDETELTGYVNNEQEEAE